eukprot:1189762-Prorocentrum_minimum.AAC.4
MLACIHSFQFSCPLQDQHVRLPFAFKASDLNGKTPSNAAHLATAEKKTGNTLVVGTVQGSIGARASAVVTGLECGRTAASRTPGLRVPRCQPINNIARAFIKRCDVKASCVRPLCVCCIEAPRCKPS